MKYATFALVTVASLTLAGVAGCSDEGPESDAAPVTAVSSTATSTTRAAATTTARTQSEIFMEELRAGGIFPTPDQLNLLYPSAIGNCDIITSSTLSTETKYAKLVELIRTLGQGKNIFDAQSTSEAYMNASIRAFCPQYESLIPTA